MATRTTMEDGSQYDIMTQCAQKAVGGMVLFVVFAKNPPHSFTADLVRGCYKEGHKWERKRR